MHKSIVALIVIMAIAVASVTDGGQPAGWDQAWACPRGAGVGRVGMGTTFIVRLTTGMAAFGRCFFGLHRLRVWLGNIIRCAERAQESATERALSMGLCVYWLHGARGLEAKAWQLALPPHFS